MGVVAAASADMKKPGDVSTLQVFSALDHCNALTAASILSKACSITERLVP